MQPKRHLGQARVHDPHGVLAGVDQQIAPAELRRDRAERARAGERVHAQVARSRGGLDEAAQVFREFVAVIKRLRTPGTGCPWDLEQDHRSLRPFLIEEAYEVLETIERGDDLALREELGDLLLQVVLHAQVADDRGAFSIAEVIRGNVRDKWIGHEINSAKFVPPPRPMYSIGG